MNKRELVFDIVKATKARFEREGMTEKTVSVKIRVHSDLRFVP
jgi:tRNA-dihydrouridine synthase